MSFEWVKRYFPESLYSRAALILLVPVVSLQLVVSIVFIQRHYEGVTNQMTRNVALELRYLREIAQSAPTPESALNEMRVIASPLAFVLDLGVEPPEEDNLSFYDLSGKAMARTLHAVLPSVLRIDVSQNRLVILWVDTRHGPLLAMFDRRRVSASNPHQLLVLMVSIGILMTLVAFVFLRNQLRPIMRLARASDAFGKGRVTAYRPSGAIEIRAAGKAFLDMRARIERQIEQRTMMLSGVSHDLRTPLTRLRLSLSMLEETSETEALLRDVDDMERLLDEFLAFTRDDSLDDPELADPKAILNKLIARYQETGSQVEIEKIKGDGLVMLRPVAVERAVDNLVGNAIRYGTKALVSLQIEETALVITVEDDGPGIPAKDRLAALKPFVRLDAARNQDRGSGVGLGLAIANDIARRHGGALELGESVTLGGLQARLILAR